MAAGYLRLAICVKNRYNRKSILERTKKMKKNRVVIVGGGASGLMAAIQAARAGAEVTILEHNDRVGKKILSTGNGKCNLTNLHMSEECFRGADPKFIRSVLGHFTQRDAIDFFEELGIFPKEKNGYVYPRSEQASAVLDVLRLEAEHQGVKTETGIHVRRIRPAKSGGLLTVESADRHWEAEAVVLATGSKAAPASGSDGSGYELAKSLGHAIIRPLPALVQLRSDNNPVFRQLAGIRTEALVSLMVQEKLLASDRGELQLTDYGISGIPVFQVSRYASRALADGKKVTALVDFWPDMPETRVGELLEKRRRQRPDKKGEDFLTGLFPKKLAWVLLKQARISQTAPVGELSEGQLASLADGIKKFAVPITAANPFANAQVCCGGVAASEIDPDTMESSICRGLYFAGEIMDVDGICGGYNLQWAWSTGAIAGIHAGRNRT